MLFDKRIIKTRNGIKTALMQLLLETEIGNIKITDLAEKAQINRSTFYLHYNDVFAVLKDIENEIAEDITACIDSFNLNSVYESIYSMFTQLTELLNEKPTMKNYILESTSSVYIIGRLKEIFVEKAIAALHDGFPDKDTENYFYPLTFASAGIVDTYVKWAHSDKTNSLEDVIKTVSSLTQQVIEYIKISGQ